MSETHDISEAETHTIPTIQVKAAERPIDFEPLFADDTEDFSHIPMPARSSRKRWLIWGSAILILILLGGGFLTYRNLNRATPVTYTQAAATTGNLTVTAAGTGPVQAGAVYNLNFPASAPITAINVHVGQQVHQGDVLATIDPTALQNAINQAQNGVNSAQTSVNNAYNNLKSTRSQQTTSLDLAKITLNNAIGTNGDGTNGDGTNATCGDTTKTPANQKANCIQQAKDQYAQAQNQANSAIANAQNQVTSAQQQLTSAQTALQTAQSNLQSASLIAPHDGVIDSINGRVGENSGGSGNGSSSASSSALIVLVDASSLTVAAQINEANIASVAVNQPATFTVAAYPSKTFRATVSSISILGTASSSVVTYLVNLAVDPNSINGAHVYPGMTATVNITTDQRIGVVLVPSTALSFSTTAIQNGELSRNDLRSLITNSGAILGTGSNRGIVVELKNGKLVPVLVTTGLANGQFTEIVSGLNEGDQVVVSQTGGTSSTSGSGGNGGGRGGNGGGFGGNGGGGLIINGKGN